MSFCSDSHTWQARDVLRKAFLKDGGFLLRGIRGPQPGEDSFGRQSYFYLFSASELPNLLLQTKDL